MDNEIISFNLARIERGREKLCKCDPPHYEIDTVNRIVSCQDCGATVDAFDALVTLARRIYNQGRAWSDFDTGGAPERTAFVFDFRG